MHVPTGMTLGMPMYKPVSVLKYDPTRYLGTAARVNSCAAVSPPVRVRAELGFGFVLALLVISFPKDSNYGKSKKLCMQRSMAGEICIDAYLKVAFGGADLLGLGIYLNDLFSISWRFFQRALRPLATSGH